MGFCPSLYCTTLMVNTVWEREEVSLREVAAVMRSPVPSCSTAMMSAALLTCTQGRNRYLGVGWVEFLGLLGFWGVYSGQKANDLHTGHTGP